MDDQTKQILTSLLGDFQNLDYVNPGEIPDIPLYMDQITTFMENKLSSCKRYPGDKILTKTMINNYTKNNLIPPPVKKKYSRDHLILLLFVYYLKDFLSISDIETLLKPLTEKYFSGGQDKTLFDIYSVIYELEKRESDAIAKDVVRSFRHSQEAVAGADEEDREYLETFAFICRLSHRKFNFNTKEGSWVLINPRSFFVFQAMLFSQPLPLFHSDIPRRSCNRRFRSSATG